MSNSSQQKNSLDDLITDSLITLTGTGADTFTITGPSEHSYTYDSASMSTITLSPSVSTYSVGTMSPTISTISIDSIDSSSFTFNLPEEWVDSFPAWSRVNDMCKNYPGLEIAFRNFQTVYQLVKDDYDNPVPKK